MSRRLERAGSSNERPAHRPGWRRVWTLALLLAFACPVAAFELAEAQRFRLDNGLQLIVLEEPALPVISVQMLYRVGARNEQVGLTGLTHFLEHMAFRASEGFPDTGLVSSIYAVGGEWHGYTWLDSTVYFATVPADHLELALRIEADRMARLLIPAAEVEAERGAILTEMHGYDNDPASLLKDAVLQVSFLQHPYRNNSIGWESDVESIGHADVLELYRRSYVPANAVLAVVGRVEAEDVARRVRELFGTLPGGQETLPPPTVEPPQRGLRRIELRGPGSRSRFEVAYRAPSVTAPDYPAFLLTQQVLGGGRGANFAQNEFGDPVLPGSRLDGIADDLVTWYPPQAAPYVFTIAGSIDAGASTSGLESRLQEAIDGLIARPPTDEEVAAARLRLLDELVYDVETTEDAAHQLASFAGIDALDVLLELPDRLAAVAADDIARMAAAYLRPHQRTIGWYLAGAAPEAPAAAPGTRLASIAIADEAPASSPANRPPAADVASAPQPVRLGGGVPVIFQRSALSPAAYLRLLVPAARLDVDAEAILDQPVWRHTSLDFRFRPSDLEAALQEARAALLAASPAAPPVHAEIDDPAERLTLAFDQILGAGAPEATMGVTAIALVGDLQLEEALPKLEAAFGDLEPVDAVPIVATSGPPEVRIELPSARTQAQLGYVVAAPAAGGPDSHAWRMLLYVLSHGYEGRLGVEAIARRGLVYFIDSRYLADGNGGRVSLAIGVDPGNLEAMHQLLRDTLSGLAASPPTEAELAEAKAHLIGRRASAAQSNEEISAALLAEWVDHRRLLSNEEFAAAVNAVRREDLQRVLPAFLAGTVVIVAAAAP